MLDEIINYVQSLQNQVEVMIIDVKGGDYCILFCNYNYDNYFFCSCNSNAWMLNQLCFCNFHSSYP